ncbi:hypothetical protein EV699_11276 [Plasticicumulans lactativorans]|uniref:Uncharacterized protein n=1 Tax=Plasticicumulans lactativorans TaxID=1133106 RepID=A0A4R2L128_9GAMM|nr:hypothetical protein [Plasticicumulans lactativorans]TCO80741.1 hypothetical protein EV699_11276 [Plasticicumulans lactativorans]
MTPRTAWALAWLPGTAAVGSATARVAPQAAGLRARQGLRLAARRGDLPQQQAGAR